jgi:nickel-dependent lactate racemase
MAAFPCCYTLKWLQLASRRHSSASIEAKEGLPMQVDLAYGRTGLTITLPEDYVDVVEPVDLPGVGDPMEALRSALRTPLGTQPLHQLAGTNDTVAIVFCDITRPAPNHLMVPAILAELAHIPREQFVLINATGMHRPNTEAELRGMLGDDVVDNYRIVNHDSTDKSQLRLLGETASGGPVWINSHYLDASVKILTGFIEPHFFAGFSGGSKLILPGIAGADSVMHNHNARMIGHPNATWGHLEDNPIHREQREAAMLCPPDLSLNVTINKRKEITGVFAGEMIEAHQAGCAFARQSVMRAVEEPYDIVITTNSGYPLDLNLYQAVKGMSAAYQVVKQGGAIVIAAECSEGIGHGHFEDLLQECQTPEALLDLINSPGFSRFDQWEAQILAQILLKAEVHLYADNLSDRAIEDAHLIPSRSIEQTVAALRGKFGEGARICVLPMGPLTIPYIAEPAVAAV